MSEDNFCGFASRADGESEQNVTMQRTESDSWWASSAEMISVQTLRMT